MLSGTTWPIGRRDTKSTWVTDLESQLHLQDCWNFPGCQLYALHREWPVLLYSRTAIQVANENGYKWEALFKVSLHPLVKNETWSYISWFHKFPHWLVTSLIELVLCLKVWKLTWCEISSQISWPPFCLASSLTSALSPSAKNDNVRDFKPPMADTILCTFFFSNWYPVHWFPPKIRLPKHT